MITLMDNLNRIDKVGTEIEKLNKITDTRRGVLIPHTYFRLLHEYKIEMKTLWDEVKKELEQRGANYEEIDLFNLRFYIGLTWKECGKYLKWSADQIIKTCDKFGVECDKNEL